MSSRFPNAEGAALALVAALALALGLGGCNREARQVRGSPLPDGGLAGVSPTALHVGGPRPFVKDPRAAQYEENAYHIGEGKRLYEWFNCYGCHAAGGGDIGPPLMDDTWRYGGEIEQIRASILEGRPNGMPSFAGRIPDTQVWEIAAYVRSMSGHVAKDAAPSRGDQLGNPPAATQVDRKPMGALTPPEPAP